MAVSRITPSSSPLSRRPASSLDLGVGVLPGVGPSAVKLLERLGIRSIGDLLWHLPTRHLDYTRVQPLRALRVDAEQSTEAIVGAISERRTARGQMLTEIELLDPQDGSPTNVRATWFGRQFIKERFRPGQRIRLSGKVTHYGRWLQLARPNVESADAERVHTGRMVPVYRLTEGLKEGHLRRWLHTAVEGDGSRGSVLAELPEPLPPAIRARRELLGVAEAMREVHFPSTEARLIEGRRRLAFDELLTLQLGLAQRRARWQKDARAPQLHAPDADVARWIAALPFTLTAAQQSAFGDIRADIARQIPMSRLLEGDVGSGKTVVAALGARIAVSAGAQVALMAPTELLAEQHHRSLRALFSAGGPSVELLTASIGAAARRDVVARLASGALDVVVGTHALVVEGVDFHRLGLVVVDEQHRFGVRQRTTLREKGVDPHLLLTTATPIPRTLTQTIYRDLDLSVIDELPAGRQEIRTEVRPPDALPRVWPWLREHVNAGEQAFVVCPRIDPGDGGEDDAPSAVTVERDLRTGPLSGLRIGLLHGRLPAKERDLVMRRFAGGEIDVLVATTVVEVGIDVPNATMMIVLGAERFGLAQLHQLRGRVGRGERKAFCVLVSQDAAESERLGAMTERRAGPDGVARPLDGFDLAKRDLEIRGAGEFLGDEQSGASELRIVDLSDVDPRLAAETAAEADAILAADPTLERPEHADLAVAVEALWRRYALA
ncbi:MAG TPA: ATP-dependent DNA helicase RecG [Candidatus Saccharimonadales bacterium]|nr:ATP-dependent DNA helicase RecG [Candidatus Saccharimonadales bacterium]